MTNNNFSYFVVIKHIIHGQLKHQKHIPIGFYDILYTQFSNEMFLGKLIQPVG